MGVSVNFNGKPYLNTDVDESEDEVKGTSVRCYGGIAYNANASVRYLQLFNATSDNVTVGSTTPDMQIPLAGNSWTPILPAVWDTALTIAASTNLSGNSAPGANEVIVNLILDSA